MIHGPGKKAYTLMVIPAYKGRNIMKETKEVNEVFGDVIHTYTRQQAIEDGVLINIWKTDNDLCQNAGFKIPIVITTGVYSLVKVPKGFDEGIQDFKGRLWDVLWMSSNAFTVCRKTHKEHAEENCRIVPFKVIFQMTPRKKITTTLWLVFNAHEGFTIMKPEEY